MALQPVALKHNPVVSEFGGQLRQSRLAFRAVAACLHKLVLLIYGVLKSGTPFNLHFGAKRLDIQDGI